MDISVGRMRVNGVIDPGLVFVTHDEAGMEVFNFPVRALREQILECQNCLPGGEFISAAEIKKGISDWNGKPITINHPRDQQGELEFANRDDIFLKSVKVGFMDNARWQDGFLLVDAHLSRVLADVTVEGRGIVQALLTGASDIEISTGYGMDLDFRSGTFDGERYHFSQTDIMPDHIALLPIGMEGACSIEDGCGAARAAQARVLAAQKQGARSEELSDSGVLSALKRLLGLQAGDATKTPEGETEPGEPGGTSHSLDEDTSMDREKTISALVTNEKVDFSQEELEAFNDERLTNLAALAGCGCGGDDPPAANSEGSEGEGESEDDPTQGQASGPVDDPRSILTAEERAALKTVVAFADRIPDMQALVDNAQAAHDAERVALVSELTANERCAVSKEDLESTPTPALRGMKRSFEAVDYSGQGGPRSLGITEDNDQGFMPLPDITPVNAAESGGE